MSDSKPPGKRPGWYVDGEGVNRWWSGQGWTDHTQEAPLRKTGQAQANATAEPQSRKTIAGLRSDVAAAQATMHRATWGAGRELVNLPTYLADGEVVHRVAIGTFGGGTGLVALTDKRVLFLRDGLIGKAFEDFPLGTVTSVAWAGGMVLGKLQLTVSGARAEITAMDKHDGRPMADAIRGAMGSVNARPEVDRQVPAVVDIPAQLLQLKGLLDAGVLEEAEYSAKKAELLARM